jgi:hypothetical protein
MADDATRAPVVEDEGGPNHFRTAQRRIRLAAEFRRFMRFGGGAFVIVRCLSSPFRPRVEGPSDHHATVTELQRSSGTIGCERPGVSLPVSALRPGSTGMPPGRLREPA